MRRALILVFAVLTMVRVASAGEPVKTPAGVQRLPRAERVGTAWSVRVPDGPLVWTGLVFAADNSTDARRQADGALDALRDTLSAAGADLAGVVRLNAYVANASAMPAVHAAMAARFASSPVAFSLVPTPLTAAGALVAFEAVATTARAPRGVEVVNPLATVMPAGAKLFISGQAERGTDLASGVKLTMAGLQRTLTHFGLGKADVVQVKAFIRPFAEHAVAQREIAASFEGGPVPAVVLMEWVSDLHTEIEIVAAAPKLAVPAGDTVAFLSLPWLTTSPRYSRAAVVPAETPLIFIGGIEGGDGADPRTQMKTIFERLGSALFDAGSSYRHLAKATYYLADPKARAFLGDIRGVYFDPARPPAASALEMTTLGFPGRAAVIDMIAVPVK
jgi:enamine deaminase RidA (YjgF/YER057c/UK114 family)